MTEEEAVKQLFPDVNWEQYKECNCCFPIAEKYGLGGRHHPSCPMAKKPLVLPYLKKNQEKDITEDILKLL